jgi:hypothetical protein
MTTFILTKELEGDELKEFLDIGGQFCSKALLVVRDQLPTNEAAKRLLDDLQPYILEKTSRSEWPGTKLFDSKPDIHVFRLCKNFVNLLTENVGSLYRLLQPDAPEDLCLLREDNTPFFVTIAHENASYLELTESEKERLMAAYPKIFEFAKKDD